LIPATRVYICKTKHMLMQSKLDPNSDSQVITPTDDPYGGEFNSRLYGWDDDEE
jgi:hypothetical protein